MPDLLHESIKRIQSQGGRMTAQRRLILETLQELESHPTAEELHEQVSRHDPTLHLSTVYRNLRWLEQEGLVSSRFFGDERLERFDPALPAEHYHFVCSSCKKIIEFDSLLVNTIKAQFELHSGASVDSGTIVLHGICADCLERHEQGV
ncbi:MAG: transcriptional repressor [Chloroflexota bacterium]|nr:transcriptional repressor [Chloroflexota bacterium]